MIAIATDQGVIQVKNRQSQLASPFKSGRNPKAAIKRTRIAAGDDTVKRGLIAAPAALWNNAGNLPFGPRGANRRQTSRFGLPDLRKMN
ncbi:hypothetical protein MNKW57_21700 [Biformimicrobium ophioploci]|uniref:Uncharacterized protein n=1 Tax=Biformimicrobium ophioploci TaxID=3036711 RepID=A0ABQ6M0G6_9GAMM|nr:hypothetical protein MNKW57_21700 [Microbulbifer sp. NKW57]